MGKFNKHICLILAWIMLGIIQTHAQSCPDLDDVFYTQVQDCDDQALVCIEIGIEDILSGSLDFLINDVPFNDPYLGCEFDSTIVYGYQSLLGEGELGPYHLDSWYINGALHSGEFQTIGDLVNMMNTWDPTGQWTYDDVTKQIRGGDLSQIYSDLLIEQLQLPGTHATLGLNYGLTALSTYVNFPVGQHSVEITNGTDCNELMDVYVACTPTAYETVATYAGLSGQFCLDESQLLGSNPVVEACSTPNNTPIEFIIESDGCITYLANNPGESTACFVICDDLGICDTTYLTVLSLNPPDGEIIIESVHIGETVSECLSAEELNGSNFTISNSCPQYSDENIEFYFEDGSLCVEYTGISIGTDTACIVICDDLGMCDSTMFYISAYNPMTTAPIAINDETSASQGTETMVDVLANDTVEYVTTLTILNNPIYGQAYVTMDNEIAYTADAGYCGGDTLDYLVCNAIECDTAQVAINVLCSAIKIYNGFSPNGDGVNDHFRIDGIEAFPNCMVKVYNIWGNMVYENTIGEGYKYETGWDGTWNGKHLIDGNYFYMIDLNDGTKRSFSGYLLLHR